MRRSLLAALALLTIVGPATGAERTVLFEFFTNTS